MKKSTLITTIAMIVVVVVALSTATYAWFSSSSQNYVTQQIATQTQEGLTVLVNANNFTQTGVTAADFSQTALLSNTQYYGETPAAQPGIRSGLWVPTAAITGYPADNSSTTAKPETLSTFLTGKKPLSGTFTDGETHETSPDLIRITNNMTSARKVTLTIYIGAKANDNSRLAAQGVCAYIAGVQNTGTPQSPTMTKVSIAQTKYNIATYPASVYTPGEAQASTFIGDANTQGNAVNHYAVEGKLSKHTYWAGTPIISAANNDAGKAAIPVGYECYTLSVQVAASLGVNESINLYVYTWLDGAYLDDNAKNAEIAIGYSFGHDTVSE